MLLVKMGVSMNRITGIYAIGVYLSRRFQQALKIKGICRTAHQIVYHTHPYTVINIIYEMNLQLSTAIFIHVPKCVK